MKNEEILELYRKAGRRINDWTDGGQKGHHPFCNYQPTMPGQTFCNCGITDTLYALNCDTEKDTSNVFLRRRSDIVSGLAKLYRDNPQAVALICDNVLDVSGKLLGEVRDVVREN